MEMTVLCHVCLDSVLQKHATALLTDLGTRMKWALRLEELLLVSIREGDSSAQDIIFRVCRRKVEATEKNLAYLREKARTSYERLSHTLEASRKHTKPTSSAIGVSPATGKARPPAKINAILLTRRNFSLLTAILMVSIPCSSSTPKAMAKLHHVYR